MNPDVSNQGIFIDKYLDDRLNLRNRILVNKFDGDNYLYDLYENEEVE